MATYFVISLILASKPQQKRGRLVGAPAPVAAANNPGVDGGSSSTSSVYHSSLLTTNFMLIHDNYTQRRVTRSSSTTLDLPKDVRLLIDFFFFLSSNRMPLGHVATSPSKIKVEED